MTPNEIKKALYKEKPIAHLVNIVDGVYKYRTYMYKYDALALFEIPIADMGTSRHRFKDEMPGHELIRWLQTDNK